MRHLVLISALAVIASAAHAAPFNVPVDQTRQLPFMGDPMVITVGNRDIADVRVVPPRTVMVIGKKAGVTNIVIHDAANRVLFNGEVAVSAATGSGITIYRGAVGTAYVCNPVCQPPAQDGAAPAATAAAPAPAAATPAAPAQTSAPAAAPRAAALTR